MAIGSWVGAPTRGGLLMKPTVAGRAGSPGPRPKRLVVARGARGPRDASDLLLRALGGLALGVHVQVVDVLLRGGDLRARVVGHLGLGRGGAPVGLRGLLVDGAGDGLLLRRALGLGRLVLGGRLGGLLGLLVLHGVLSPFFGCPDPYPITAKNLRPAAMQRGSARDVTLQSCARHAGRSSAPGCTSGRRRA